MMNKTYETLLYIVKSRISSSEFIPNLLIFSCHECHELNQIMQRVLFNISSNKKVKLKTVACGLIQAAKTQPDGTIFAIIAKS